MRLKLQIQVPLSVLFFLTIHVTDAFTVLPKSPKSSSSTSTTTTTTTTTTQLHVFDFFKQRATEGVSQLKNLSNKTSQGKLLEGLTDAATYTSLTTSSITSSLTKSRNQLLYNIESMLNGGGDILEELEDVLLQADIGMKTSLDVMEEIKSLRLDSEDIFSRDDLRSVLRGKLIEALKPNAIIVQSSLESSLESSLTQQQQSPQNDYTAAKEEEEEEPNEIVINPAAIQFSPPSSNIPTILFIMGANGMGKTTTIGKLASRLRTEGNQKVLLAACDTFRAGAVEQLEMWSDRANVDCYSPSDDRKTPAAVLYGALDKAQNEDYDVVLVDTSGRLSNNDALTEELLKMKRVIQKRFSAKDDKDGKPILNERVPHETLLVIDAAQGRMALESAKTWHKEIGLTGLILTKLDGSARGGSVVAVSRELGLPVKLIGCGEKIEDLRDFDPEAFVDGLLGIGLAGGSSNKNEGKILAKRLEEMRKARDERSKKLKIEKTMVGSGGAGVGGVSAASKNSIMETNSNFMNASTSTTATLPPRPTGNPNKKKKNKKKNRR